MQTQEEQSMGCQRKPGHLGLADAQVALGELVRDIEAQAPKLAPLLQRGMEEGQRKVQSPQLRRPVSGCDDVRG